MLSMLQRVPALLVCLILAATGPLPALARTRVAPPGIVLILADDLGWGDPRCYNPESKVPTPNLDRLAAEGMRFIDAHSPSAVCTPTRYGILTGRYAWRSRLKNGVLWGYSPPLLEPGLPTIASHLKAHGYITAGVGKWHLGLEFATRGPAAFGDGVEPAADPSLIDWSQPLRAGPHTAGFDHYFGIPASLDMVPYVFIEDDRIPVPPTARTPGSRSQRQGGNGFWREGPIAPGFTIEGCQPALTAHAVAYLREQRRDRPFFLYFPLTAPHDPWVPTEAFRGRSGAGARGDFVAQVDDTVGQVLQVLEERGLVEDTLVLFTSDNGAHWLPGEAQRTGHAANGPWRGMKSDAWEGGHRVPLLARWPGHVPPGRVSEALVGLNDLFATLAEVAGAPLPPGTAPDSVSFFRALRGRHQPRRPPLVQHSIRGTFAVREGPWKLIEGSDSGGWSAGKVETPRQLYRLDQDPGEQHNLALRHPDRVKRLEATLRRLREEPQSPR